MKLYFFDTARCIHKAVPNLVPKIPGYLRVSHSRDTKQPTAIGCVHNTARAHRERPHAPLRVLRERAPAQLSLKVALPHDCGPHDCGFRHPCRHCYAILFHRPLFIMKICKIWLLFVHHDFQAFGSRFFVHIDSSGMIYDLRDKIVEKKPEALSRARVDPNELTVWKTKGEMIFYYSTSKKRLAEILKSIDVDDVDAIEEISASVQLEHLELSDGQTLIMRLPGSSCISTAVGCVLILARRYVERKPINWKGHQVQRRQKLQI